jgi:hypothetical protein
LHDADLDRDHRYWTLDELLDLERRWTEVTNTSPAEQAANQTILDTIKSIRHHQNAEVEITVLIQISQEAARQAFTERGADPKGTHRLSGERTTIEEVLIKLRLFRWPLPAKNDGCIRDDCRSEHVEDGDHIVTVHRANQDGKGINVECRLTATLARLLDADMYMSKYSELYDVYATAKRPKSYSQWTSYVASFNAPNAKVWHYTAGDFCGVFSRDSTDTEDGRR